MNTKFGFHPLLNKNTESYRHLSQNNQNLDVKRQVNVNKYKKTMARSANKYNSLNRADSVHSFESSNRSEHSTRSAGFTGIRPRKFRLKGANDRFLGTGVSL